MPFEESYKQIEGDWKDFRFRRVTPADYSAVFEHISSNFSQDESTSKLLGWSLEYADDVNRMVEVFLKDDMSFIAEHKQTGKVAGLRITFDHNPTNPTSSFDGIPLQTRTAKLGVKLINDAEALADLTNKRGIDRWAEFLIASTDRDFRKQGLAGEFYDRSLAFLKAEGFNHILVVVTSPYTKMAAQKRGFEELARLDYENFLDFDGKPAFNKEDLTSEHSATVMLKTLTISAECGGNIIATN